MGNLKVRLKNLWKSRTHWAGVFLGMLVAAQSQLMEWIHYKLTAEDYALAGIVITVVISTLRIVTTSDLKDK